MYSSYLSTLVLYSDGFIGPLHFLVLYSDCLFGFLYKKWFTECHFAIVPYHEMSAICKILAYIQDTGMPLNFHGIVQQYLQKWSPKQSHKQISLSAVISLYLT